MGAIVGVQIVPLGVVQQMLNASLSTRHAPVRASERPFAPHHRHSTTRASRAPLAFRCAARPTERAVQDRAGWLGMSWVLPGR